MGVQGFLILRLQCFRAVGFQGFRGLELRFVADECFRVLGLLGFRGFMFSVFQSFGVVGFSDFGALMFSILLFFRGFGA